MGGGDLNLKKSWHPSTLRNIERVWKAEQKHEVEKQKIEQLQKELAEERAREEIQAYAEDQGVVKKREERLDWMYQGPAAMANREDYLLGRKVDKTLQLLEQEESGVQSKNEDFDSASSIFSCQDLSGTATVDLANKIREDPLFSIMKKEKEQRKTLLSNPVKMKQLQQMLQESLSKKKKRSKKKHTDNSTNERDCNIKKHTKSEIKKYSSDEDEIRTKKYQDHTKSRNFYDERRYHRKDSLSKHHNEKSRINSSLKERDDILSSKNRSRESYCKPQEVNKGRSPKNRSKKNMDAKEKERRLKEMQEDAKWCEEQRKRKVKRYKEDDEREEKMGKIDSSNFIKPVLSKAAWKGSLENRVKQKLFSIQRSSTDMDKHFVRR